MKFTKILEELRKGKKVTREKWETAVDACSVYFIVYNQKKGKCEYYLDGRYDDDFVFVWDDITAEDWKIYQENPTQMWKPQADETYYSIGKSGIILGTNNAEFDMDRRAIELGNCFKTKEKALHMVEKIKIINRLRELSNINFGNDINQLKYSIGYDIDTKKVRPSMNRYTRIIPFEVYFTTREDCVNAIEEIGEDNLKKYYFDIVEEDN